MWPFCRKEINPSNEKQSEQNFAIDTPILVNLGSFREILWVSYEDNSYALITHRNKIVSEEIRKCKLVISELQYDVLIDNIMNGNQSIIKL